MKLEIKYIFPTSTSGANFYIYELPEGLEMRKILAHGTRMQKNPQARGDIFWIFMELCGSKVQHAPQDRNFINGITNSKIVY